MLYYLPLERYPERYTWQLQDWTEARFKARNVAYQVVTGQSLAGADHIRTGVALDAHGRNYYGLTQMAGLVALLGAMTSADVIYMQDMYQPGYEALPYILAQLPNDKQPAIYTHCWAQSIDPNDFTFPMRKWMRHFELMVDTTVSGIFFASPIMIGMLRAALFNAPLYCAGQPFDMQEVQGRCPNRKPLHQRKKRVVYTARWDTEKQPQFFTELAWRARNDPVLQDYEFAVCTSQPHLRSNDTALLTLAREAASNGIITLYEGLTKDQYYAILADSQAHFTCALQDFVSYALVEASAMGTPTLAPAFLAYPDALHGSARQLYMPWNIPHALDQLADLVEHPPEDSWIAIPAIEAHRTLDVIIDNMTGEIGHG